MSQSTTWDTLMVARDARLSGRPEVAAELMREVEQDLAAYVRRSPDARDFHRRGWYGAPIMGRIAELQRSLNRHNWMIEQMLVPMPIVRPEPPDDDDGDIEIRTRYWGNFITPPPHGYFPVID